MSLDAAKMASQIAISGAAFAGLTLVFFGNALTAFLAYDVTHRDAVRADFRVRAGIALLGFLLAVFSVGMALAYNFFLCDGIVLAAVALLGVSAALVVASAVWSYLSAW